MTTPLRNAAAQLRKIDGSDFPKWSDSQPGPLTREKAEVAIEAMLNPPEHIELISPSEYKRRFGGRKNASGDGQTTDKQGPDGSGGNPA